MTPTIIISAAVFIGVTALIIGLVLTFRGDRDADIEERLNALTGGKRKGGKSEQAQLYELMAATREGGASVLERAISRHLNLVLLFEQANVSLTISKFFVIIVALAGVGMSLPIVAGYNPAFGPLLAGFFGLLPFAWLLFRRKRRLQKFASQLPEALELISRALRAGHSLGAGFSLVAQEMSEPIRSEFHRTFEEQNLGKPLDEALNDLTERVPNLDLKFFATAIILQRQTGGDLAEILDKIGRLIRERFQIWGQVQALTGEGRLSGIVLLALPPALFVVVYKMNPEYLMLLFTDELGKKMLVTGILMQLFGALVIRKIVNIRV